jgi:hypothetical protein
MLIIPGQRKMVNAMMAGQKPDPIYGIRAKQRSVHNNYFTLPVLFIMISNHYAMTYRHEHAWAVLAVIMAAGRVDPPLLQPAPQGPRRVEVSGGGRGAAAGGGGAIAPKAAGRGGGRRRSAARSSRKCKASSTSAAWPAMRRIRPSPASPPRRPA